MGKLKTKAKAKTTSKSKAKGGAASVAVSAVSSLLGRKSSGTRRSRVTPEKLAKKIIIFKLKKKLAKLRGY
jgi:hypothetical protein